MGSGEAKEAKPGLSKAAIREARRGIAAAVRSTGPAAVKVRPPPPCRPRIIDTTTQAARLREVWEWGVEEEVDRRLLLDFAIQEAGRFKAAALLRLLNSAKDALCPVPAPSPSPSPS